MDAVDLVRSDFLYLRADWTMQAVEERLRWLQDSMVVIERVVPWRKEPFFYVFPAERILDRYDFSAQGFDGASTLEQVMNLHETDAVAEVPPHTASAITPEAFVVVENGRVVGYRVTEAMGMPDDRTFGGESYGGAAGTGALDPNRGAVSRKLVGEFPDVVELGQTVPLSVYITSEAVAAAGVDLSSQPVGTEIRVMVQIRKGFTIDGEREGVLTITPTPRTTALEFQLRATQPGPGDIRLLVFHVSTGVLLGRLPLNPMVVEPQAGRQPVPPPAQPAPAPRYAQLAPSPAHVPDLTLFVEDLSDYGINGFVLRLTAADPTLNLFSIKFGPVRLKIDPGSYFKTMFEEIQSLPLRTAEERAASAVKLRSKGALLFQTLLPEEVQQTLWDLKDRIASMIILTEEPWVPWELCRLMNPKDPGDDSGTFFCQQFSVTRWMIDPGSRRNPAPDSRLTMNNIAVVKPSDSGLPYASQELAYLKSLEGGNRSVTSVPAQFMPLRQHMAMGTFDVWHFTGHGSAQDQAVPDRMIMLLENGQEFRPEDLTGVAKMGQAQPIVFLNACEIGRSGMSLTEIGGWAKGFLAAGAGAFVGAYWSIYDKPAYEFATEFYARLDGGLPIGQAVKEARCEIQRRFPGDPTWLAYTVYADPFAVVEK